MTAKRKRKRRLPTIKYTCEDYLIEGENEEDESIPLREGEWFIAKRKLSGRTVKAMIRLLSLEDSEAEVAAHELESALDNLAPHLARMITDWNWINHDEDEDENGELPILPSPTEDVILDLDLSEIFYITGKLFSRLQNPKN